MENWVKDPTVLKMFAKHYKTGEVIPDELLAKIKKADLYNTGILHVSSYLFPALIDMEFHARTKDTPFDVNEFDNAVLKKFHVPYELSSPYPSTQNGHIFTGGYAAGYYSYIWAAVLDADAFSAFKESGDLFNPTLSTSFRKNILSRGATDEPMTLFKNFRGREPKVEPLIERNGLK
jgi:peptidyl-dipeptidase Dcp